MAKKIIVIGSGFGGLAAALRMRAKGFAVTLVEKHPDLGGRARVFKKGKFIFFKHPSTPSEVFMFFDQSYIKAFSTHSQCGGQSTKT